MVSAEKLVLIFCLKNTLLWNKNFVFPYLNVSLKRRVLSAGFHGSGHNYFSPFCYLLSRYQFVFPSDALPD